MNRKKIALLFMLLLALATMQLPISAQEAQTVCLITDIGRINDGTFNQFAYEGMQRAVEEFGLQDTFIETQNVVDYETHINTCLDGNYDIVITVGFALGDAAYAAAAANPEVYFIGVDQDFTAVEPLPNLVGLQFREDQAGFIVGTMAALVTESNIVAGVYGLDIFPVIKFRNGFEQGVRYINPEIQTLGVYIPDFQAPDQGQEAARQFIGEGADVIFGAGGPTGSGGISYAAAEGVKVIGVDQDEYFTTFGNGESPGAENLITSAIKRVDNGVYDMIAAVVSGEGFPINSTYVLEIAIDGIDFSEAHDADVPQEVIDQVTAVRDGLRAGTIVTGVDPVTGAFLENLYVTASNAGGFTVLLQAIDAAGLTDTIAGGGPFTVFAPTDEAFAAYLEAQGLAAEDLLNDTQALSEILQYHVVQNAVSARDVVAMDGASVSSLSGAPISISIVDGNVVLNGTATVVTADIFAANGIIHVIDSVLVPPEQ